MGGRALRLKKPRWGGLLRYVCGATSEFSAFAIKIVACYGVSAYAGLWIAKASKPFLV